MCEICSTISTTVYDILCTLCRFVLDKNSAENLSLFSVTVNQATAYAHTHTPVQRPFVRDYPGEPVPERKNLSGFY